jgi:hypothetical protein
VKGPGTLELHAPLAPLAGRISVRGLDGAEKTRPFSLPVEGRVSLAVGAGLQTVRVTSESAGSLRVIASAPGLAASPEQLRPAQPPDGQEVELRPAWSRQLLAQTQLGGPPVEYAMVGRGEAALRVSARVRLDTPGKTPARLRWSFVDARGQRLAPGAFDLDATPAPEDRLETAAGPAPVSQPVALYLWPPAGAERLRFESDRPALLSVASPGYPLDPAAPPPLATALLRYAPPSAGRSTRSSPPTGISCSGTGASRASRARSGSSRRPRPTSRRATRRACCPPTTAAASP